MNLAVRNFALWAEKTPDALCIWSERKRYTFSEAYSLSRRIAAALVRDVARKGDCITIELERTADYLPAMYGALMAGCPFAALDASYPEERRAFVASDCGAALRMDSSYLDRLPEEGLAEDCFAENRKEDLAFLIYTSGSTGRPKGVMISHWCMEGSLLRDIEGEENHTHTSYALIPPFSFVVGTMTALCRTSFGGSLYVVPDRERMNMDLLADFTAEHRITNLFLPPAMVPLFREKKRTIVELSTGGDRFVPCRKTPFELWNKYGMSETCCGALQFRVDRKYRTTPIGRPMGKEKVYLLDANGNEAQEGEICFAGYIASGYMNLKEETERAFTPNPFRERDGWERLLHTSDMGRRLPSGDIVYTGRMDWMVNINGQRVEPGEITAVLGTCPGVNRAFSRSFTDASSQAFLCSYYTSESEIDQAEIREFLSRRLPQYMIPRHIVRLDAFPLTTSGKVDRSLLPNPEQTSAPASAGLEPKERIPFLKHAVCSCSGLSSPDFGKDLMKQGFSSIAAIRLAAKVFDRYGVSLDIASLLRGFRLADLDRATAGCEAKRKVQKRKLRESSPLTSPQTGMYLEWARNPEDLSYNIPVYMNLDRASHPEITAEKAAQALKDAVEAHPCLKCTFSTDADGTPAMISHDGKVTEVEMRKGTEEEMEAYTLAFPRPFDLGKEVCRFAVFQAESVIRILADVHHIMFDGTSSDIFFSEVLRILSGEKPKGELTSMFDLAAEERKLMASREAAASRKYFADLLSGADTSLPLRQDLDRGEPEKGHLRRNILSVSREELESFAGESGGSMTSLLLSALGITLAKYGGRREAVISAIDSGRRSGKVMDTVGMTVRTYPVLCRWDENTTPAELTSSTARQMEKSLSHPAYPFAEMSKDLDVNADVMFVYQGLFSSSENEMLGLIEVPCIKNPLSVQILPSSPFLTLDVEYDASRFSEELVSSFFSSFSSCLAQMTEGRKVDRIGMTDAEQKRAIDSFNSTEHGYDMNRTAVDMFLSTLRAVPDSRAAVYLGESLTYSQVGELSLKLASILASHGIGRGDAVAVLLPRGTALLWATMGVLRSGACFVPADMSYPEERISYMLSDCGAKAAVAVRGRDDLLSSFRGEKIYLDEIEAYKGPESETRPEPKDTCVILYTSGTTGRPKGILIPHRSVTAFAESFRSVMEIGQGDVTALYASYGFDASVQDIVLGLAFGAEVHVIDEQMRLDFAALDAYFTENRITHAFMTTQVGRMFAEKTSSPYLRHIMVGGETLAPVEPPKSISLINSYGPAETFCGVTSVRVEGKCGVQSVGKPHFNTRIYIADRNLDLLPAGAVGELLIAGHQVSDGYLNNAEMNAKKFIDNPYTDETGYRTVYRTGDLARYLPSGEIEFIGRNDTQVKVRGFRIEPSEVEEAILSFGGIDAAAVTSADDPAGGKMLLGYFVSGKHVDIARLRAHIGSVRPPYMIPKYLMQIERMPLSANQKVDLRALPKPDFSSVEWTQPRNETEKEVMDAVEKALGHRQFGVDTSLQEAGMTSIGLMKLSAVLSDRFSLTVRLSDIVSAGTPEGIALLIEQGSKGESRKDAALSPLLHNQTGLWLEQKKNPESTAYNIPMLLRLSSQTDEEKLLGAIRKALSCHPYLLSSIVADGEGNPCARRNDTAEPDVQIISVSRIPEKEELIRPFDMDSSTLFRSRIFVTEKEKYLFIDVHHILADGVSMGILLDDVSKAYLGGEPEPERYTGFDAGEEEKERRQGKEKQMTFFEKMLGGEDLKSLPRFCPDTKAGEKVGILKSGTVAESGAILEYCRRAKFSPSAFFNAAFSYTLSQFLYAESATYCTVFSGRDDPQRARSCGMFVRTLPVHTPVDRSSTVEGFIRSVQNSMLQSVAMDLVPFPELCAKYSISPDIFFNYQGELSAAKQIGGLGVEQVPIPSDDAKAKISIEVFLEEEKFDIHVSWMNAFYCREMMESLLSSLRHVAGEFLRKETLEEVGLLSEEERKTMEPMNRTEVPIPDLPVHEMIRKAAALHPDSIAVRSLREEISYRDFDLKSDAVASALRSMGLSRGETVGIVLERGIDIPVAETAVLKAGGAFLPMLPSYPDERVGFCLEDSSSRFVITSSEIIAAKKELFSEEKPYRALDIEELKSCRAEKTEDEYLPLSPAYVIYTSGSTGKPKGVAVPHRAFTNYIANSKVTRSAEGCGAFIAMASVSFDMSLSEIYTPLAAGRMLYIATEDEVHDYPALLSAFLKNGIDFAAMTPTMCSSMVSIPDFRMAFAKMRTIVLGAEAFTPQLYNLLKEMNPELRTFNGYGPTECTQSCSAKLIETEESITIGGPNPNTRYAVAGRNLLPLPRYAVGELLVSGDCLAIGYVNLEERTRASFINFQGERSYRTGDLVYINRDLEAEFIGRNDSQIKLRGFRIELDEVEKAIMRMDTVRQCKVLVRNNGKEDYLAAFFTADREIDSNEMTKFLRQTLNPYMVPSAIMQLREMPMTQSSKIDFRALPQTVCQSEERVGREPKTPLEKLVAEAFAKTLGKEKFSADDNFFDMGGTSLSASKAVMMLKSGNCEVEYQDIFDCQTPELLAARIAEKRGGPKAEETADQAESDETQYDVLRCNTLEYAESVERHPLGSVLLTGATGFLGNHVLKELIESEEGNICCLVRKGKFESAEMRLKAMLFYYFEKTFDSEFGKRIRVVEADVTDPDLKTKLRGIDVDTIINCAALVKHYAKDSSIMEVNVHGVENLIEVAREKDACMVQISTVSIPGAHSDETYRIRKKMAENELFVINDLNNQYGQSKYQAELRMIEAMGQGMRGKILRVGNLMGRYRDGEFQTNMRTNSFLNGLKGFAAMGMSPISHSTDPMSFSPIDSTAKAVVLLSGTNDCFTAFNVTSRTVFDEMKVIEALNRCGIEVTPVKDSEYYENFRKGMADEKMNAKLQALMTGDRPDIHMVETETRFTADILYRLGFSWPFVDDTYLDKVIKGLDSIGFFM